MRSESPVERLSQKYGRTRAQTQAMMAQLARTAAGDGLDFRLETARSGNTFDAHRVLKLAAERGKQSATKTRLMRGYMQEGAAIGEPETLVKLGAEAGLDAEEVRAVLASDRYADEVRVDEREAREIGIQGVPFFVFGQKYAVSGAQPVEVLLGALERAWAEA